MHDPNFLFHISSIFRVFASHPCQTHIRYFFFSFFITLLLLDLTYTLKCLYMREFSHVIYFDQSQISKQRETWKENSPKDQIPTSLYTIETEKMFLHLFYLDVLSRCYVITTLCNIFSQDNLVNFTSIEPLTSNEAVESLRKMLLNTDSVFTVFGLRAALISNLIGWIVNRRSTLFSIILS